MDFELVRVPLEDARLAALALESEATGVSIEALVQEAVSEFLTERKNRS
jgi:hypothetical protein